MIINLSLVSRLNIPGALPPSIFLYGVALKQIKAFTHYVMWLLSCVCINRFLKVHSMYKCLAPEWIFRVTLHLVMSVFSTDWHPLCNDNSTLGPTAIVSGILVSRYIVGNSVTAVSRHCKQGSRKFVTLNFITVLIK